MEVGIKEHVDAIRLYIETMPAKGTENSDIQVKKSQLSAIQTTIRQLERKNIPVPDSLKNEKITLATAVTELENNGNDGVALYEALLELISNLGQALGRSPHNELYKKLRDWRRQRTSKKTIRDALLAVLKAMGGSAKEPDIMKKLNEKLGENFTVADMEKQHGRRPRWQTTVRSVRNQLIKDGVLTQESRKRTWTLAK